MSTLGAFPSRSGLGQFVRSPLGARGGDLDTSCSVGKTACAETPDGFCAEAEITSVPTIARFVGPSAPDDTDPLLFTPFLESALQQPADRDTIDFQTAKGTRLLHQSGCNFEGLVPPKRRTAVIGSVGEPLEGTGYHYCHTEGADPFAGPNIKLISTLSGETGGFGALGGINAGRRIFIRMIYNNDDTFTVVGVFRILVDSDDCDFGEDAVINITAEHEWFRATKSVPTDWVDGSGEPSEITVTNGYTSSDLHTLLAEAGIYDTSSRTCLQPCKDCDDNPVLPVIPINEYVIGYGGQITIRPDVSGLPGNAPHDELTWNVVAGRQIIENADASCVATCIGCDCGDCGSGGSGCQDNCGNEPCADDCGPCATSFCITYNNGTTDVAVTVNNTSGDCQWENSDGSVVLFPSCDSNAALLWWDLAVFDDGNIANWNSTTTPDCPEIDASNYEPTDFSDPNYTLISITSESC